MSDKDKRIKKAFEEMNQNLALPDSLSPENVQRLLAGKAQTAARKNGARRSRLAGMAAALAVALFAGIFSATYFAPEKAPAQVPQIAANSLAEKFAFCADMKTYNSYESLRAAARKQFVADYASNINIFFDDMKDAASEDNIATGSWNSGAIDQNYSFSVADEESKMFGRTNVQVADVDEADILKNDGRYLYYVTQKDRYMSKCFDSETGAYSDSLIHIADCVDPKNMREVATVKLPCEENEVNDILEIYLSKNRMIVIAHIYENKESESDEKRIAVSDRLYYGNAETHTGVYLYDITDRSAPVYLDRFYQDGSYLSSRLIGDRVVFWSEYHADLSSLKTLTKTCIPETSDGALPIERIAAAGEYAANYILLSSYSLADGKTESISVCGVGMEAYCTADTLYLASWDSVSRDNLTYYKFPEEGKDISETDAVKIMAFSLTDGIRSRAVGKVIGLPLNQFSLDEYNGYLRIATTTFVGKQMNYISVLDKNTLQISGFLPDVAPDESIRSVRFAGDTGYVVTFLQTDPLFVVNLAEPTNPVITGELKIPGFSSYLHPFGESYLIGVGYGGDDDGLDGSVKFSLFDVSDPTHPQEIAKEIVPNAYLISESHKAFFLLGDNTFAVPIQRNELVQKADSVFVRPGVEMAILRVTDKGLALSAQLKLPGEIEYGEARATYIDNAIFMLTDHGIAAYDRALNSLGALTFSSDSSVSATEPTMISAESSTIG